MALRVVGIHSTGAMGSAVAQVLARHGLRPVAALAGRSERTRTLAAQAGVEDVGSLEALVRQARLVLSILPPGRAVAAAQEVAAAMGAAGATPPYADCNAVSAETTRAIGAVIAAAGAPYVDASIIGPPPRRPGVTRIYASGPDAATLAVLNDHGLDVRVLEGPIGQASAFKTCYASLTKGLTALGSISLAYGRRMGLDAPLAEELRLSQPELYARLERGVPVAHAKAARFVGEMEEHGRGFAAEGLPPDMMAGAAALYRLLAQVPTAGRHPEQGPPQGMDEVIAALADRLSRD